MSTCFCLRFWKQNFNLFWSILTVKNQVSKYLSITAVLQLIKSNMNGGKVNYDIFFFVWNKTLVRFCLTSYHKLFKTLRSEARAALQVRNDVMRGPAAVRFEWIMKHTHQIIPKHHI